MPRTNQRRAPTSFCSLQRGLTPPLSSATGNTSLHCLQHRVSSIQLGTQSSSSSNSIRLVWKLLDNWHSLHPCTHTHTHWHTNEIFISPSRFPCLVQLTGLGLCVDLHTTGRCQRTGSDHRRPTRCKSGCAQTQGEHRVADGGLLSLC